MQCSVLERNLNGWNIDKMVNNVKNPCKKDYNLDNIVDQQCTRYQEDSEQDSALQVGMPTRSVDHTEAVRRYYAAFPALKKGQESPLQYYLPPPAWCRKTDTDIKSNMQSELIISKEWNSKKKFSSGKERRNSYHGPRKGGKRRCNTYSRSFESKESLPEWVTHGAAWDMEEAGELLRALDDGYGTGDNTAADEPAAVPDLAAPDAALYAQFEAKFDRSLEALWAARATPDDDCQELPLDFQELLSSPAERLLALAEHGPGGLAWLRRAPEPALELHARLRPLRLAEPEPDPFALFAPDDLYDAAEAVAAAMRSLAAINHSRDRSGFAEVPPRRRAPPLPPAAPPAPAAAPRATHFRPIRREPEPQARYTDGAAFDIRGDLDAVAFHRSASGGLYLEGSLERYLEYRPDKEIDYGRLQLTEAQRCPDLDDPAFRLRFPLRQCDAAAQTEPDAPCEGCGRASKRPRAGDSIWAGGGCEACAWPDFPAWPETPAEPEVIEQPSREAAADRKRRHSAALRCAAEPCPHPHARFLACCELQDRPLTR